MYVYVCMVMYIRYIVKLGLMGYLYVYVVIYIVCYNWNKNFGIFLLYL